MKFRREKKVCVNISFLHESLRLRIFVRGVNAKKKFFSWADLYEPIGSGELIKSKLKKKYTLHHNINVNKELSSLETSILQSKVHGRNARLSAKFKVSLTQFILLTNYHHYSIYLLCCLRLFRAIFRNRKP